MEAVNAISKALNLGGGEGENSVAPSKPQVSNSTGCAGNSGGQSGGKKCPCG